MHIPNLKLPLANTETIRADNRVASLLLSAPRTRSHAVTLSSAAPDAAPALKTPIMAPPPGRTPSDLQVQWGKIGAIHQRVFLTENLRRSDPHQTFVATAAAAATAATAAPTTHKPSRRSLTAKPPPQLQRTYVEGSLLQITSPSPYTGNLGSALHDQPFKVASVVNFAT